MALDLTAQRVLRDVEVVSRAGLELEPFLDEALTSIQRAVPHLGACVGTVDPSTLLLTGTLKFGDLHGQDSHDHEWGLIEYGEWEDTTFIELAHRAVPSTAVRSVDPGSYRLNEFMVPRYGYTDEIRTVLRDHGQVWGAIAMFRADGQPAFDDHDVELLSALSETMSVGMRLGLLCRLAEVPEVPPTGPAVVMVDSANRIVQRSTGAEHRLDQLKIADHQTEPTGILAALVGSARRYARGETTQPPRCRVRSRDGIWLVLHASPMTARDGGAGDVVITIEEARPPEIVPLVVAAFDLTERERAVTERVLQGLDTKEIAASLHLSAYTVQDHLKSVFEKASVRSRRELIARVYFDQYVPRMGTDIGPDGWFTTAG
ncbi:LuxR C-terminal-related transcriptional regulator [Marmoricola sp. RAF53]|uniref:LuxR C-terminal-related transcriptional regulator n=1 Tax=Marmoricola sp. RAF53 TaxID=3233059 RepID=UPI003F985DEB